MCVCVCDVCVCECVSSLGVSVCVSVCVGLCVSVICVSVLVWVCVYFQKLKTASLLECEVTVYLWLHVYTGVCVSTHTFGFE